MTTQEIKTLILNYKNTDEEFKNIVKEVPELYKNLSVEFEIAESTVRRWANGVSNPHPRMQIMVIAFIELKLS